MGKPALCLRPIFFAGGREALLPGGTFLSCRQTMAAAGLLSAVQACGLAVHLMAGNF